VLPVFRQAFQVSLAQWHEVFHIDLDFDRMDSAAAIAALAKKAEQNHDAEALAFAAERTPNQNEALRLADEAVRLDPSLTWVYATTGAWYAPNFGMERVALLQKSDPQNALPYLIKAQKIGVTVTYSKEFPLGKITENPGWTQAMEAAFLAPRLDEYRDRRMQLDHRVLARYQVHDPFQIPGDDDDFPAYGVWYASRYAESTVEAGQTLESRGDRKAASERYLAVAHFCDLAGPYRMLFFRRGCKPAFERLANISEMQGNKAEAAFYSALGDEFTKTAERDLARRRNSFGGNEVSRWNAFLVRLSGLALLFCAALLVVCALGVVVRSQSLKWSALQASQLTLGLASIAAVGALLASAVLFASYRPYSELMQQYLSRGDTTGLAEVSSFLSDVQLPLGSRLAGSQLRMSESYVGSTSAVFYFWLGVALLCGVALLAAVLRHVQTRQRTTAAA
jgi:hypothetical protein